MSNAEHVAKLKEGVNAWNDFVDANDEKPGFYPDLSDDILRDRNLSGADLTDADMSDSNLIGTDLSHADLWRADLSGALLHNANLSGAFLKDVDFTGTLIGNTTFGNNDLSTIKGLDKVIHHGPSSIGIDTILKSKGNIPAGFLMGAGVPEEVIDFLQRFKGQSFPSCFISYAEVDDAFTQTLYNDLTAAGVRCWDWKKDAKWGKSLMRSIDEAVSDYDRLIVVCTEQSLNSPAVIREIERALQKEDELARKSEDSEVLFPIMLDNYVLSDWTHYRKADVIAKSIADFREWGDPEVYRRRLERLIRDLKAE